MVKIVILKLKSLSWMVKSYLHLNQSIMPDCNQLIVIVLSIFATNLLENKFEVLESKPKIWILLETTNGDSQFSVKRCVTLFIILSLMHFRPHSAGQK